MSSGGDLQYLEQNRVVSLFTHRRNRKRITSHACRSIHFIFRSSNIQYTSGFINLVLS